MVVETASGPAGIDVDRVTEWLVHNVAGVQPPLAFVRLPGGHSNLTYQVTDASGRRVVLRRPPLGDLLPTAHDMSREWRFISALHATPVPVAEPLGFCEDPDVTGKHFYVMGYVDGHVLHNADVAEAVYDDRQRRVAGESLIRVLADLHAVDPDDVGIGDVGRKEGYVARQLKRWYGQWEKSKTRELPAVDEVHDALAASIPDQGPARIVHGDYRLGNTLTDATGRVAAVLDWEIATLGDPLADLGYLLSQWLEPGEVGPAHRMSPSTAAGFPSRAEMIDRYAERSGRDLSRLDFYVAFSHWKSACIVEGVYARYLAGALSADGVDVDAFRISVERSAEAARTTLDRTG